MNSTPSSSIVTVTVLFLRIFTFVFLLIALILIVIDKFEDTSDYPEDTYNETEELNFNFLHAYRYMLSTIVIGSAYNLLQMALSIISLVTGNRVFRGNGGYLFDFLGDKIISFLLISGSAAEFGFSLDLPRMYELNHSMKSFLENANIAASLLLIGFLLTAIASIFSSFAFPKKA
ncbi:CASP-like protein 4D1 [Gastrolobium bilobum]|uniref:CASP-like protein 4D1 n=1 Tax=Gastrolobium bilobum TaxID=150636 RepID=UPI002AB0AD3E|nr:CASP-like protein 4D1 [Gastrolobium bilobum]